MHTKHSERDEGAAAFHAEGELAPSSQSAASAGTVIQFPNSSAITAAALLALEDAMEPDTFESLGSIAVRIVADWKLPRISCRSAAWEEAIADLLPSRP
jgi:hypothetical protein